MKNAHKAQTNKRLRNTQRPWITCRLTVEMRVVSIFKWCHRRTLNSKWFVINVFVFIFKSVIFLLCNRIIFHSIQVNCLLFDVRQTARRYDFKVFQGHFVYKKVISSNEKHSYDLIVDHQHHHLHYRDKESKV